MTKSSFTAGADDEAPRLSVFSKRQDSKRYGTCRAASQNGPSTGSQQYRNTTCQALYPKARALLLARLGLGLLSALVQGWRLMMQKLWQTLSD